MNIFLYLFIDMHYKYIKECTYYKNTYNVGCIGCISNNQKSPYAPFLVSTL